MDTYYPNIDESYLVDIEIILRGMAGDPLWLERKACPYSPAMKATIAGLVTQAVIKIPAQGIEAYVYAPLTDDELEMDLAKLHHDLKNQNKDETSMEKTPQNIQYFRIAVSLITKIVELRERMTNVKMVSEFKRKVIEVFNTLLTPDQANKAIGMLEESNKR